MHAWHPHKGFLWLPSESTRQPQPKHTQARRAQDQQPFHQSHAGLWIGGILEETTDAKTRSAGGNTENRETLTQFASHHSRFSKLPFQVERRHAAARHLPFCSVLTLISSLIARTKKWASQDIFGGLHDRHAHHQRRLGNQNDRRKQSPSRNRGCVHPKS
ncbi:hypothetical protein BD289DRAFT_192088 [Coniella lustricola]|uniref:Uncharacterized protein n=1 Tax=Coniella lustricola TaxID=2025994 RepID=A0A2T3ALW4_9PEZI|nr:hypothetical protein BD289DRAFT_192088 [Coniella lustricola]